MIDAANNSQDRPETVASPLASERAAPVAARANPIKRMDLVLLAIIVLLAFGLRFAYVMQLRSSPLFDQPQMDARYHDQWAQAIAKGESFVEGPYFRAPLYPAFLGTVYRLFGHGYLTPRIVQAVIGALSCGLLFLIGRRVFGRAVGAVAGFVAACYWILIYFDGELLIPTLIVFLDLILIWLLLRAVDKPRVLTYGLAGVVLALSAIARPNILLFAPVIVFWMLISHRKQFRRGLGYVAGMTAGCLLVVLPITIRNYVVGKDVVLIASQGGVNFYIGNNPLSDGRTAVVPGTPSDWLGGYYATIARAEQALGRKLKPSEVSQYYYRESRAWIGGNTDEYVQLLLRKFSLFWSRWEISNNKGIYFWTEQFTPIVKFLPINFAIIGPLGIVGLVLSLRRGRELFPLWGFVVVYTVGVVLFFCTARYRVPILPPLILLAVAGVFQIVADIRRSNWITVLIGVAVLIFAVPLVYITSGGGGLRDDAYSYRTLAINYQTQGKIDQAIESYHNALALKPDFLSARYNLGTLLLQLQRTEEGIAQLQEALKAPVRPEYGETPAWVASVHKNLATAQWQQQQFEQVVQHYRAALKLVPEDIDVYLRLGGALGMLRRDSEAVEAFTRAVELDPDHRDGRYGLARALMQIGRLTESTENFRETLRIAPQHPPALLGLGRVLLMQDRNEDAIAPLRQCLLEQSNNLAAVDLLSLALINSGHYRDAISLLRQVLEAPRPEFKNRLAFLLAACPEDELRDGTQALEYAQQVCPQLENCEPRYIDTQATALAELALYEEAAQLGRTALELARQASPPDEVLISNIEEHLALFEAGKPYRMTRP